MKNYLLTAMICFVAMFAGPLTSNATKTSIFAKKITIKTIPEHAQIWIDGQHVGTGTYQVKFDRHNDFYVISVVSPGYIRRTYRLLKSNPKKTVVYRLPKSEAYEASSSGEDSGIEPNTWMDITCRKDLSEDVIWKRLMNVVTTYFDNVEVRDKSAGWIKSGWFFSKFKYETVRTRLEIKKSFTDDDVITYRARIITEIKDNDCEGSNCYKKYERTMKRFEPMVQELQTTVSGGE